MTRSRNPSLIYAPNRLQTTAPPAARPGNRPGMVAAGASTDLECPRLNSHRSHPFQLVGNASGHVLAQAVLAAAAPQAERVADVVQVAMYDVAVGLQAQPADDASPIGPLATAEA